MALKRKPPEGDVRRVASMGLNLPGVTTNKNGHTVQFESFAERILLVLFERDKTVLDYRSQPETFEFTGQDKKIHRYTPDFKVWKADGTIEIHEVTRTERQKQLRMSERVAGAQIICQKRQWKYIVHTEQTLPQTTEVTNLLALLRYRLKRYGRSSVIAAVQEYLRQKSVMHLQRCTEYISRQLDVDESVVFATLCHLLWHGEICTDLQKLLIFDNAFMPDATVWLPEEEK
jgi:TnsA endonuclease N terminal